MNVKVITKLIESEKEGVFANAVILTADDGTTAIETLQEQISAGRQVHFVLMDFVMVWYPLTIHGDRTKMMMYVCIRRLPSTVRMPLA
jgi:CheY-like chemotaxis protein